MFKVVGHRLEGVAYTESPNFDARPLGVDISLVVIHCISLPPGKFGTGLVHDLFLNTLELDRHPSLNSLAGVRVSSHLFMERNGKLTQFVPFHERAWHAGESSFGGVPNCNDYSIGIELEGTDDLPYTDIQYQVLVESLNALISVYPGISRSRIVGHSEVAPGRKTDPGTHFDWERVYRELELRKR